MNQLRWRLIGFALLIIFFRIYNIEHSARFTEDEASDLVRMHEIWEQKKITLVGPISSDKLKVFGSLTYYMLLPFTIAGKFDPIAPVYGAAFWGILTAGLIGLITIKINRKLIWPVLILLVVWYPLLEASRWAWNPHLVPFWMALGVWLSLKKQFGYKVLAGLALGMSLHNHYVALFAVGGFMIVQIVIAIRVGKWRDLAAYSLGLGLALAPFILFDLRHPPGIFLGRYLLSGQTPDLAQNTTVLGFIYKLFRNGYIAGFGMARIQVFGLGTAILSTILLVWDSWRGKKAWIWAGPFLAQIVGGAFLGDYHPRYFLPGLVFYLAWIIFPREKMGYRLQLIIFGILIISSIFTLKKLMTKPELEPDIATVRAVAGIIETTMTSNPDIKNPNVTTVSSPDMDMMSIKYRYLLSLDHINFRAASEYDASESLFVISASDEKTVRSSDSFPLMIFRKSKLRGEYAIPNSVWKVYWFSY